MIKILIINPTFSKEDFCFRWKLFAESYQDVQLTLLAPIEMKFGNNIHYTNGKVECVKGKNVDIGNYHVHLIQIKKSLLGEWKSPDIKREILQIKPDIVYYIGGHTDIPLMQVIAIKIIYRLQNMKIINFSMRGHKSTLSFHNNNIGYKKYIRYVFKLILLSPRLIIFKKYTNAVFCHYPDAFKAFRDEGYKKPIYIQTQVGVNPNIFKHNQQQREIIRKKYNIGDSFLFGSASRFNIAKGIKEIIAALPKEGNWKYLLMGWGRDDEVKDIQKAINEKGLQEKVILTGYINGWQEMAMYWNALDCAIHFPVTTPSWEETFSLALVQAMITGLPVIGSSSGSVPYQIGPNGIIVPERDIMCLQHQMSRIMHDLDERKRIGENMKKRANECFNIYHLNELFYLTIKDIINGVYDEKKIDMAEWKSNVKEG